MRLSSWPASMLLVLGIVSFPCVLAKRKSGGWKNGKYKGLTVGQLLDPDSEHLLQGNGDFLYSDIIENIFDVNEDLVLKIDGPNSELLGKKGLSEKHIRYYDIDKNGELDYAEALSLFREYHLYMEADFTGPDPQGHMKRLGEHGKTAPFPVVDYDNGESITPAEFWKTYGHPHKDSHRPVLLKGVEKNTMAYKLWDEDYILKNYGWVDLKLEPGIEMRGNRKVMDAKGHRLNVSKYFRDHQPSHPDYKPNTATGHSYAVSILPQPLGWDVTVPACLLCGSRETLIDKNNISKRVQHPFPAFSSHAAFDAQAQVQSESPTTVTGATDTALAGTRPYITHMYEANFWISFGYTRSQLHYDKENNMNCLYRGQKRWVFVDTREDHANLEWVRGGMFNDEDDKLNAGTDWVGLDPDRVDLRVFSKFRNVTTYEVIQNAGDCVYIPYSMMHYVNKTQPGYSVSVSYMWLPQSHYDEKACLAAPNVPIPLSAFDTLWYYSGNGVIPQGYPDPYDEVVRVLQDRTVSRAIKKLKKRPPLKLLRKLRTKLRLPPKVFKNFIGMGDQDSDEDSDEEEDDEDDEDEKPKKAKAKPWKKDGKRVAQEFRRLAKYGSNPEKGLLLDEMLWFGHSGTNTTRPQTHQTAHVPLEEWLRFSVISDPAGGLPCNKGHVYEVRSQTEWQRMENALDEAEKSSSATHGEL